MEQEKLEEKVREILGREGFKIENGKAYKQSVELDLGIYSSEKYNEEDVDHSKDKVFVDEGLQIEDTYTIEEEKEYNLPSFEIMGDIAVINDLSNRDREQVVEGILAHHDVKTILLKTQSLSGEYRVGDYEKLYGGETETIHREHGYRLKVDPTKAFFSEREATERKRVLDMIEDNEKILVMFCGIGPFPVFLAKKKGVEVVGVEKNPDAVELFRENVEMNKVQDMVKVIEGDVVEKVPQLGNFDRILMPSPTNADEFLDEALEVSSKGTKITLYGISEKDDLYDKYIDIIEKKAKSHGFETEILDKRVVSEYSPAQSKIAIDFAIV